VTASRVGRSIASALVAMLLLFGLSARGAAQTNALDRELATEHPDSAPVMIDGGTLFRVKGTALVPAQKRAGMITARFEQVARDRSIDPDALEIREDGDLTRIIAGDVPLMAIADFDTEGASRRRVAELLKEDISRALKQWRAAREPHVLIANTGYAVLGSVLTAMLGMVLFRLRRWTLRRLQPRFEMAASKLNIQKLQLVHSRQVWLAMGGLVNAITTVTALVIAYLYLSTVLGLYPWTRALAGRLIDLVVEPLRSMGLSLLGEIPNIVFVALVVLITRYVLKAMLLVSSGVEHGTIEFHGFDREWAQPTYRIARILVVAFAVVVAYPYIPGSESQAFKGVSLFLGLVFSLGSSSVISNVIAGYTMTYRRAFRIGDRIQVGELTGFVSEMTVLVTRLRSLKNEEIVVPNSEILGKSVINFSALARESGLIVHTTVGIGYETPWRQVEAMLRQAAARTPGLEREPAPFVLQKSLGDFCVVYEINAHCRDATALGQVYTALHQNILDVFNEYGVQIMTPNYEGDPAEPKLVQREQWYAAPASPPGHAAAGAVPAGAGAD
jgi:small-conductance mechanosensitive channel